LFEAGGIGEGGDRLIQLIGRSIGERGGIEQPNWAVVAAVAFRAGVEEIRFRGPPDAVIGEYYMDGVLGTALGHVAAGAIG
jgi:hypothetical protein